MILHAKMVADACYQDTVAVLAVGEEVCAKQVNRLMSDINLFHFVRNARIIAKVSNQGHFDY